MFTVADYLVSALSFIYVGHVAEFGLAVLGILFGLVAIGSGTFAIVLGNGLDAAAIAGGGGILFGVVGL